MYFYDLLKNSEHLLHPPVHLFILRKFFFSVICWPTRTVPRLRMYFLFINAYKENDKTFLYGITNS